MEPSAGRRLVIRENESVNTGRQSVQAAGALPLAPIGQSLLAGDRKRLAGWEQANRARVACLPR